MPHLEWTFFFDNSDFIDGVSKAYITKALACALLEPTARTYQTKSHDEFLWSCPMVESESTI